MRSLILCLSLLACGNKHQPVNATQDMLAEVSARVAQLKPFAPVCEGFVSKQNCDQGDAMLFSGLLCMAGNKLGCDTARGAISESGKVWRSPKAVNNDTPNSSSRDMLLGAMAYFVGSKDVEALERVTAYVRQTGKICEDATDGRCNMTANTRDLLDQVRAFNGLSTAQSRKGYSEALALTATTAADGYELHLVAIQLLILKRTGTWNATLQYAAQELVKRQGRNALFEFVAHGKSAHYAELMLAQVPDAVPAQMNQWSFERRDNQEAWKSSMIWEFVFVDGL